MQTRRAISTHGFSLLELLIVLAVFSFIVGGIFNNLTQSQKRYQFEQEVAEVQQTARNAVDIMEREIKLAGFPIASYYDSALNWTSANSERVAAGFITLGATNLVFEADLLGGWHCRPGGVSPQRHHAGTQRTGQDGRGWRAGSGLPDAGHERHRIDFQLSGFQWERDDCSGGRPQCGHSV